MPPKKMTDATFDQIARRFRVLSDPTRLRILFHIGTDELTVSDIVERTGGSQSNISKHLSTLASQGLVNRRRQGTSGSCWPWIKRTGTSMGISRSSNMCRRPSSIRLRLMR